MSKGKGKYKNAQVVIEARRGGRWLELLRGSMGGLRAQAGLEGAENWQAEIIAGDACELVRVRVEFPR